MSERGASIKAMCMRQTDEHFFLAVSQPLPENTRDFRRLEQLTGDREDCSVHTLHGGSQVFVYPRDGFDPNEFMSDATNLGFRDVDAFKERVVLGAQQMRARIAIDQHVHQVSAKIQPSKRLARMILA